VDDHHLRGSADLLECLSHRVLPAFATADNQHRLRARAEINRWISGEDGGKRDDDFGNGVGIDERVDAALEDGAAAEGGELFRLPTAEAQPASPRSDDGGNVSSQ
jgi:hypothetical protein